MKKYLRSSVTAFAILSISSTTAFAVQSVSSDTNITADGQSNGAHFTGDFTLTVPDGSDVNTNTNADAITTAIDNTGSVTFLGTTSVGYGVVGSSASVRLKSLDGGAANKIVTVDPVAYVTTVTVRSTGTLILASGGEGSTINFAGNGDLRISNDSDYTFAITTNTDNTGSISMFIPVASGYVSQLFGQVGTSTAKISSLTGGLNADQMIYHNDVFVTNTYVTQKGTLTFNGNLTGSNLYFNGDGRVDMGGGSLGTITTLTNNTGSVFYSGDASLTGAVGSVAGNDLKALTVQGGVLTVSGGTDYAVTNTIVRTNTAAGTSGTLKAGANQTFTGNVLVNGAGTFDAGSSLSTVTGDFDISSGTTLKTTFTSVTANTSTAGHINAIQAVDDARVNAGSTLNVTATPGAFVPNGAVIMLVDANGGGAAVAAPGTVVDNSITLSFTPSVANNDLIMTAARANLGTLATNDSARGVGTSLNGFSSSATGDMATIISNLDTLPSAQAITQAFNQFDPEINGGATAASFSSNVEALNTVTTRLDNARNGSVAGAGQNGISTGDEFRDVGIWSQGFGSYGDQDDKDGISGYTRGTWGAAGGLDFRLNERTRIGGSFAYSQSDIDANDSLSNTDIKSYQGSVYGTYEGDPWFLDLMFSTSWNTYEGSRRIQFATIDRTASQDYDGMQYSTNATFGYPIPIADNWSLVPLVSLLYSHLDLDSFTEANAGALNLTVQEQSYDFLQQGLGAKIITEWTDNSKQRWVPSLHVLWLYDYIGDQASSTSTFAAGGSSFTTNGLEPEQSSLNLGTGITVYPTEALSLNISYDYEAKSDYTGHYGSGTVRYEF